MSDKMQELKGPRAKVYMSDITGGQENVPISFINEINSESIPKNISYIPSNVLTSSSLAEDFESVPLPCSCESSCDSSCSCGLGSNIAYRNGILNEDLISDTAKPIIECTDLCSCKNCENYVVQNGLIKSLQVFQTELKGFGVRTLESIPKLSFVCEYAGELIDKAEAQIRMIDKSPEDSNYIFILNEYNSKFENICTIIDPTVNGNVGRYLNHSCSPNLVPVPVRADSMVPRICFFAKRDIMPFEELTYNYGKNKHNENVNFFDRNSTEVRKKCYCDSEHCLGVLPVDADCLS